MAYRAGTTKTTGKGLGRGMAAPKENFGNNNAQAFAQYASGIGLDPKTWLPPGASAPGAAPAAATWSPEIQAQYDTTIGTAHTQDQNTHNENLYQSQQLSNEYGIDDLSNPFSKMKLLQESFERNKLADNNSAASRGQYFSGAHGADQALLKHGNDINVDRLKRDYTSGQHALTYANTQSSDQYNATTSNAALQRLIQQLGR